MISRKLFYPLLPWCLALLLLSGCSSSGSSEAQRIVDAALARHGAPKLDEATVSFRLRDRQYQVLRDDGMYRYSRIFTDSTGQRIHDVLSNSGFARSINGAAAAVPQDEQQAYSASVNAVVYFALLPYFLNADAVQKEYLGEARIKGEPYHKVKVTFAEEGGGEGYQDVYVYWFHQQNKTMDYLAYSFQENGGGSRFREAVNPRAAGGVLFQDYVNYTSKTASRWKTTTRPLRRASWRKCRISYWRRCR